MIRHDDPKTALPEFAHLLTGYRIAVNEIDGTELLEMYKEAGLLYEQKLKMLGNHLELIRSNWDRALRSPDDLFTVVTCSDDRGAWAAISMWRAAEETHAMQSLVSNGKNPYATRAAVVAAYRHLWGIGAQYRSSWYRPEHPVAADFGRRVALDHDNTAAVPLDYCPYRPSGDTPSAGIDIEPVHGTLTDDQLRLIADSHGPLFAAAGHLTGPDPRCNEFNRTWGRCGLFRYQVPLVAYARSRLVGIAVCQRGAFGVSPSLLENKCDLILDHTADQAVQRRTAAALLHRAREVYQDFPDSPIPVMSHPRSRHILDGLGLHRTRGYVEMITTRAGFRHACQAVCDSYLDRNQQQRQDA
ncbi:hypothetical protein [Streptomyces yerevanensis]|uniref:hypothetical protein n=1 Tax=Streptomyces yerevanensis TaxID=66378 RepID=UPI000527CF47|nr:hypothetical protein [Streptomyces yerevanensis]